MITCDELWVITRLLLLLCDVFCLNNKVTVLLLCKDLVSVSEQHPSVQPRPDRRRYWRHVLPLLDGEPWLEM